MDHKHDPTVHGALPGTAMLIGDTFVGVWAIAYITDKPLARAITRGSRSDIGDMFNLICAPFLGLAGFVIALVGLFNFWR
jgi:hypothetical protein